MSQGLIVFIAIGAILSYFLIGFIDDIQEEDERLMTREEQIQKQDMTYHSKDLIGQTILVFKDIPYKKKLSIWHRSPLHKEYIDLFPDFIAMRNFIKDRIADQDFQQKLLEHLDKIEDNYISGSITQETAKEKLDKP